MEHRTRITQVILVLKCAKSKSVHTTNKPALKPNDSKIVEAVSAIFNLKHVFILGEVTQMGNLKRAHSHPFI